MPRVPYRFPAAGEDPIADRVRARRGARGLTPLDATLLNAPAIADGWNTLIGTLRTKNSLPDDVRELMILRIAALSGAAFEWIHHEHVGRAGGLTTAQLAAIGDTSSPADSPTHTDVFTPLQRAALAFTDASTLHFKVPDEIFGALKRELQASLDSAGESTGSVTVERQLVEATTTVGGYNLVSRFLLALDVDDRSVQPVPVPSPTATALEYPVYISPDVTLHTRVHFHPTHPRAPAIVFVNSLLTDLSMWDRVLPAFAEKYTLVTFDQRGHGRSSLPPPPSVPSPSSPSSSRCTIPQLATDISSILAYLQIPVAHAVIGVSQGGATALSFALQYPHKVKHLIACDTQAASPASSRAAWEGRIAVARSSADGMRELAKQTAARWFPAPNSPFSPVSSGGSGVDGDDQYGWLVDMIARQDVEGFARAAESLMQYDLRADGLIDVLRRATTGVGGAEKEKGAGEAMRVLLLAGELDGALPAGLKALREEIGGENVQYASVQGSGHLPMLDHPEEFVRVVKAFLES